MLCHAVTPQALTLCHPVPSFVASKPAFVPCFRKSLRSNDRPKVTSNECRLQLRLQLVSILLLLLLRFFSYTVSASDSDFSFPPCWKACIQHHSRDESESDSAVGPLRAALHCWDESCHVQCCSIILSAIGTGSQIKLLPNLDTWVARNSTMPMPQSVSMDIQRALSIQVFWPAMADMPRSEGTRHAATLAENCGPFNTLDSSQGWRWFQHVPTCSKSQRESYL